MILGTVHDDMNCCDYIQNEIDQNTPEALVLGDISHADMDYLRLGNLRYQLSPIITDASPRDTLARKILNKFFQDEIELSTNIHIATDELYGLDPQKVGTPDEADDYTLYESDDALKRKIGLPQLTAARIVCSMHNKKVFFGMPNPFLIIEELCGRLTLQELEDVLFSSMQTYHETQEELGPSCIPAYAQIDIHKLLKRIGMALHHDDLYLAHS